MQRPKGGRKGQQGGGVSIAVQLGLEGRGPHSGLGTGGAVWWAETELEKLAIIPTICMLTTCQDLSQQVSLFSDAWPGMFSPLDPGRGELAQGVALTSPRTGTGPQPSPGEPRPQTANGNLLL